MDNILAGKVRKSEVGGTNVIQVSITRPKRYDVMIAYGGHGGAEMLKAAKFKKDRLEARYPNAEVAEPKVFKSLKDFEKIWTDIFYDICKLNKSGQPMYDLHEIHIFAHSNSERINIRGGEHITAEVVKSLESLIWNPESGFLVLHSCRSGRHEEDDKVDKDCIACTFSKCQQAYVIGQMVYASFNYGPDPEGWKYRATVNDKIAIDWLGKRELVLWGCKSGGKVKGRYSKDKEYSKLYGGQLWPCRKYHNGEAIDRVVASDTFNDDDLNFI